MIIVDVIVYVLIIGLIVVISWHFVKSIRDEVARAKRDEGCTILKIRFNPRASEMLRELAEWRKTSQDEVLRDGLVLLYWCEEKDRAGKKVRLEVTDKETDHAETNS